MLFSWRWSEKQLFKRSEAKILLVPIFLRLLRGFSLAIDHSSPVHTRLENPRGNRDPIHFVPQPRQRWSIKCSQSEPHPREFASRGSSYPDMSEYWKSTVSWTCTLLPFFPTIFAQPLTSDTIAKILVQALQYLRQGYQIRTNST